MCPLEFNRNIEDLGSLIGGNDVNQQVSRTAGGKWLPGQSGNAALRRVLDVYRSLASLQRLPTVFCRKTCLPAVEDQRARGNLEPEAWSALRHVLDLIEAAKVEGDPQSEAITLLREVGPRRAISIQPFYRSETLKRFGGSHES
jgi:hypothetical protein